MDKKETDKEDINVLISALKEQTKIMSDTYIASTSRMCETIEKTDKSRCKGSRARSFTTLAFIVFLLILYFF